MKTTIINGRTFEVHTKDALVLLGMAQETSKNISLYHAYDRYSYAKERIYDDWKEWAQGVDGLQNFDVCSHSSNFFSLSGIIDGEPLTVIKITPSHNYLYIPR